MSASREKKIRKELSESGIPDIKDIRAAEEKAQQRRANILYGSIAAIFVLVAAALLVWNSNIIQRNSTALSVDGEKYSAAEVSYFYYNTLNNISGSSYASYLSLDTSKPTSTQYLTENDYMFLGMSNPTDGSSITWYDVLMEQAKLAVVQQTALLHAAEEAGFTFTDEMQTQVDATLEALAAYAKQSGMSTGDYLKAMFGAGMTKSLFKDLAADATLISAFQQSKWEEPTYDKSDFDAYYAENIDAFDVADYEYVYISGSASSMDEEGNIIEATEDEKAAALEAAKTTSQAIYDRYMAGEDLETIAKDYEKASYAHTSSGTYSTGVLQSWPFEEGRTAGDKAKLENGSIFYVVGFNSRGRQEYNTVNVRHILCKVDTTGLDAEAADYETKRQELIDAQKAEAEAILKEWKAGAATEDSFAELANAKSDDGGSNTVGGLYEQVAKGEMVDPFNGWIFDESRNSGDSDIIFVDGVGYTGYHVMYFVGEDAPAWELQVESTLRNQAYNEWGAALIEGLEATEESGIKYVG